MELFSGQELQAMLSLLNRVPMSPAEQLFAQGFFQRLVAFCQPPQPMPTSEEGETASEKGAKEDEE